MQMTLFSLLDAQTDVGRNFQGINSLAIWIPHCLSVSVLNDYPVKYPILLNDFCFTSRVQDFCSILTVLKRNDNVVYSYQNKIILTKCLWIWNVLFRDTQILLDHVNNARLSAAGQLSENIETCPWYCIKFLRNVNMHTMIYFSRFTISVWFCCCFFPLEIKCKKKKMFV